MKRYFFLAPPTAAFAIVPQAQMRVVPVDEQGHSRSANASPSTNSGIT
jgi:hypothetical protein